MHSTVTALLEDTGNWAYNIDQGDVNAVVFLDLKKAFDTVYHNILLSKLKKYGVSDIAYDWFQSYLHSREQRCFVNGSLSHNRPLTSGIPQAQYLVRFFLSFIYTICLTVSNIHNHECSLMIRTCPCQQQH